MLNSNPNIFKRSLIAVAVVSLSACSTTPQTPNYDLSQIGAGILSAGRTTADVSERMWDKTTYLLGFSDVDPANSGDEYLLMDEVDLALMEEDAILPSTEATVRPIVIPTANRLPQDQTPTNSDLALLNTPAESQDNNQTPTNSDGGTEELLLAENEPSMAEEIPGSTGIEDWVHEVTTSETLWDIAKKTTGDANNWHVLADVNNLGPNAAVFPGQQLIIPADMAKPDYDVAPVTASQSAGAPLVTSQEAPISTSTAANDNKPTTQIEVTTESQALIEVAEVPASEGRAFKLNPGETLWDFAKRTTGDATNWQVIAQQNSFTERQAVVVRPGQSILVPINLVKAELATNQESAQQIKADDLVVAEDKSTDVELLQSATVSTEDKTAVEATSGLLTEASALDETQPIKIVEATFKAVEPVAPIAVEEAAAVATTPDTGHSTEIMVSGTYYPKAIYNEADFSSSLLMRVSPGTTLQVSKAMGNWFEVTTEKGIGYVHQRDIK